MGVVLLHLTILWVMSIAVRPRVLRPGSTPATIDAILITPVSPNTPLTPATGDRSPAPGPSGRKADSAMPASGRERKSTARPRPVDVPAPSTASGVQGAEAKSVDSAAAPAGQTSPPSPASSDPPPLRLALPKKTWRAFGPTGGPEAHDAASSVQAEGLRSPRHGLEQDIEAAGKDDCMKGKFKGSGMGLLSLPGLALSALSARCR